MTLVLRLLGLAGLAATIAVAASAQEQDVVRGSGRGRKGTRQSQRTSQ